MTIIYLDHITRNDVQNNPQALFIFGDNDTRRGYGGQAGEMRGEPNTAGIRVKRTPRMDDEAFYTDYEYECNIRKIQEDIDTIRSRVGITLYPVIIIPSAGIGTGRAQLQARAPKTYVYLLYALRQIGASNGCLK
jgi:hypothetical protein